MTPPAQAIPEGYWQREASHYPKPLSPLTRSLMLPACNDAFRTIFAEYGMLLDGLEFREIDGWVYNRLIPMGGKDRKAPPKWLFWVLVRTVPEIRRRIRKNSAALRADAAMGQIDAWYTEWKPDQIARAAILRAVDRDALDDEALLEHVETSAAFFVESIERHFRLTPPGLVMAELAFFCKEQLDWDDIQVFSVFSGLSTASTEPSRRLAALTAMAREAPELAAALRAPDRTTASVADADAAFAAAFAEYQRDFGCRALRYEFADATLEEEPAIALQLIGDQLERGYDPSRDQEKASRRRNEALASARAKLTGAARDEFERLLSRAERYYPVREDNEFYTVSMPTALCRYAFLALGRRLAAKGFVASPDDVLWLEHGEALDALRNGVDARSLVRERVAERDRILANPGPAAYGKPPAPPPDFDVLPKDVATGTKAVFWMTQRVFEEEESQRKQTGTHLSGVAAAGGIVTATARVVLGEEDFDKIEPGDVLVCPITSPVWSVVFPSISGLVTNSGGILSHPAIIAREYGIPAVVATGNATEVLRDGQTVTVDGDNGRVTVVAG